MDVRLPIEALLRATAENGENVFSYTRTQFESSSMDDLDRYAKSVAVIKQVLNNELNQLYAQILKQRNLLSPFNRLPDEVIADILLLSMRLGKDWSVPRMRQLSLVSRRFLSIITNTSRFWTYINSEDLVIRRLKLSRMLPLDIKLSPQDRDPAALSAILNEAHRWKTMCLHRDLWKNEGRFTKIASPTLERLCISEHWGNSAAPDLSDLPCLVHLDTKYMFSPNWIPQVFAGLKYLALRGSHSSPWEFPAALFLGVMDACNALEELCLHGLFIRNSHVIEGTFAPRSFTRLRRISLLGLPGFLIKYFTDVLSPSGLCNLTFEADYQKEGPARSLKPIVSLASLMMEGRSNYIVRLLIRANSVEMALEEDSHRFLNLRLRDADLRLQSLIQCFVHDLPLQKRRTSVYVSPDVAGPVAKIGDLASSFPFTSLNVVCLQIPASHFRSSAFAAHLTEQRRRPPLFPNLRQLIIPDADIFRDSTNHKFQSTYFEVIRGRRSILKASSILEHPSPELVVSDSMGHWVVTQKESQELRELLQPVDGFGRGLWSSLPEDYLVERADRHSGDEWQWV